MSKNKSVFGPIVRTSFLIMLLCGVIYPVVTTGIAQVLMPEKAGGSLLYDEDGKEMGAELIGQNFTSENYFHGRVSSIEYDAANSGSGNYAPSNEEMIERTKLAVEKWKQVHPDNNAVPIDLVTNSASGLDPHISPEGAYAQTARVSLATGISQTDLNGLIEKNTQDRELGLFGEPRVNVLLLNVDLNQLIK
ncbi:potassium-transporting ATPase subunit KdpC [Planococcus alpniumensis]|uniref:potassium-transporting ATPase subunit KdpC n=1 Tax=Planococcus alpniumensis TaxID=2708345 RepID=UPI001B8B2F01|nr:potassium-transporting ATPase subunit KdpC [Planococcus sp. MSAK28401]